jgi:hypothetical protein
VETPWLGPFKIIEVRSSTLKILANPSLGGVIEVSVNHCKHWNDVIEPDSSSGSEKENDEDFEEDPPDDIPNRNPSLSEMFVVDKIIKIANRQGWKYLTVWKGFPISGATWEPLKTFVNSDGTINEAPKDFSRGAKLPTLLKQAEKLSRRLASSSSFSEIAPRAPPNLGANTPSREMDFDLPSTPEAEVDSW